jgi:CheY-like chemotaxis protein
MPQSLRILLIADNPEVIRRIGQGLQRQDAGLIMIEGADSLATARRRLGAGAYDLALVDLALGHGDGLRLLSDLVEIAPELPIVALAADDSAPDTAACLALGAHDRLAPEAMDCAGLLDRLHGAASRARAGLSARRRTQRIAGSLSATGDLAWHYERDDDDAWLAAADPAAWQLPGPECRETLDALRARIHPDDREMALRRIGELIETSLPWQLEARVKVGGGAYRWCTLRGRSQLDPRGRLERASGVLSDAQRQQKTLREIKHSRRFLRAVFDSARVPHAVLDSSGMIMDCNQAWLALDDPACHAGQEFGPGSGFIEPPAEPDRFGDLDTAGLARGIRQVLGGVADQFQCEYGDGERRWRISVGPLLNPGIAGAIVGHEEITAKRRGELEAHARLEVLECDFRSIMGPVFRVGAQFEVLAANEEAKALKRTPLAGRDVLKFLPRVHADAVGDGLAALSAGARSAVRDSRPRDGQVIRWLLTARFDAAGQGDGFLIHGVDVSDLGLPAAAAPAPGNDEPEVAALRGELEQERQSLARAQQALLAATQQSGGLQAQLSEEQERLADLRETLGAAEARYEELQAALETARREAAEAQREAQEAQREAEAARRRETESQQSGGKLAAALDAERARHSATLAALSAAEEVPIALRARLDRARHGLRADIDALVERIFQPLLDEPDAEADPRRADQDRSEAG